MIKFYCLKNPNLSLLIITLGLNKFHLLYCDVCVFWKFYKKIISRNTMLIKTIIQHHWLIQDLKVLLKLLEKCLFIINYKRKRESQIINDVRNVVLEE